jgi:hypothetical protein
MYGEKRNTYRILVGKPEVKGPLAGFMHRWEYNIKRALKETDGKAWTEFICLKIYHKGCGDLDRRETRSVEAVHTNVGHKIRLHGA